MRRARRADATVVVALAWVVGCAAAAPSVGLRPMEVPPLAQPVTFATARLDEGLPSLMRALSEHGREGYRALRLSEAQTQGWLSAEAVTRGRNTFVGMVPGLNDRRWFAWRRWRGSVLLGWCGRGVRVREAQGPEGFLRSTIVVDRVLVVAGLGDHRWGAWLEGLVLARDGWRFAPWIPHAQAVEAPRRSHPDVDLWDCDVARRPTTSARPPGG